MKKELGDKACANAKCPPGKVQSDIFDTHVTGLCLRVTDKGKKTWTFVYTSPTRGGRARISLGTYPTQSLDAAREKAKEKKKLVEDGTDPRDVIVTFDKTVAQLIELRLDEQVREQLHPKTGKVVREALRTAKEIEARYKANVTKTVGSVLVKDFKIIPHLAAVLDPIRERGSLRMRGMVWQDMKALFDYAVGKGMLEYNPIAKAKVDSGLKVKKTFLEVGEIKPLWDILPSAFPRSIATQRIVKLILLTARRVSEVCEATRSEFDLHNKVWTIPAERVKAEVDFVLPLTDEVVAIVRECQRDTNGDWLFPNREGDGPIPHSVVDHRINLAFKQGKLGAKKWTPHDLRRTVNTQMLNKANGLNVSRFDAALVLHHTSVTKANVNDVHYDMNEYFEEKKVALEKWGTFVAKLVKPEPQLLAAE